MRQSSIFTPPPILTRCVGAMVIGCWLGLGVIPVSQQKIEASVTLGSGTGSLLKNDVTDPSDTIDLSQVSSFEGADKWAEYYEAATWTSISSENRDPFESLESPSNLFNNALGGGRYKWYDRGTPTRNAPAFVQLTFPEAFVLTHFTLSSGNDSMNNRNPLNWAILGSNDGTSWTNIYEFLPNDNNVPFTSSVNTVVLFSSFSDVSQNTVLNNSQKVAFSTRMEELSQSTTTADFQNTTPYSQYRLEVYSTTDSSATQLGEWELFGNIVRTTGEGNFLNTLSPVTHLDASDSSSLRSDAEGNVSGWQDGSENGVHFSQTSADNQPSIGTITIGDNTFQAVDFSKSSSVTRGGDFLTASQETRQQTVFIVAEVDIGGAMNGIFGRDGRDLGIRMNGNGDKWNVSSNMNDFTFNGTMSYNGAGYDTSSLASIQDPHLLTAVAANPQGFTAALGSYFVVGGMGARAYDGKIAEVLIFSGTLTSYETQLVNTYFYAKYGLNIAEANRFGVTFSPTHNKEFFTIMRSDENQYARSSYGTGGFGLSAPANGYDLFRALPDGTAIFVTSNTDTTFGFTESLTIDGETVFLWDKEWLVQNLSSKSAKEKNSLLDVAFDFQDALFRGVDEGVEFALMFREDAEQPFRRLSDFIAFEETSLFFSIPLSELSTGFYTLGANQPPYVPEPATWGMLLLGLVGIWSMRRNARKMS